MDISKDLYQILEVSPDAHIDELKNAYRRLAKKYHPDSNLTADDYLFQLVQDAWDVLGDPEKRREYDKKIKKIDWGSEREEKLLKFENKTANTVPVSKGSWSYPKVKQEMTIDSSSFLERLKTIAQGKESESVTKIAKRALEDDIYKDQKLTTKITPLELWFGTKKDFEIQSLGGVRKIRVKIPRGYVMGTSLKVSCPQTEDFPAQNVQIFVELETDPKIKIEGLDISIELPISISEAILGSDIIFPTPESKVTINIMPKHEIGKKIKILAAGLLDGTKVGDLYIIPTIVEFNHSSEAMKLLAKLDQLSLGDARNKLIETLENLKS